MQGLITEELVAATDRARRETWAAHRLRTRGPGFGVWLGGRLIALGERIRAANGPPRGWHPPSRPFGPA